MNATNRDCAVVEFESFVTERGEIEVRVSRVEVSSRVARKKIETHRYHYRRRRHCVCARAYTCCGIGIVIQVLNDVL